ncbi:MAG: homoserine O-acetyltransferase MetX [Desulfohalobiaceae bacterium]
MPAKDTVGVVETKYFEFAHPSKEMAFECGRSLGPLTLAYETYGQLDQKGSNAVLVLHALTGDAHAAGYHQVEGNRPGWWETMVGPDKGIDTNKYFVICSNVLGGCMGSTGPSSCKPGSQERYALDFPLVTIGDMVQAQMELVRYLGISKLLTVVGGSMGGMQALEWSVRFPEMVQSAIPIATTSRHSAMAIAFNEVARQAIMKDPNWNQGNYYHGSQPVHGQAVARMIGHVTYLSDEALRRKFDRGLQDRQGPAFDLSSDFQVGSYLQHQGEKFVHRFDANSLLYLTKATDYFNLAESYGQGSLVQAFSRARTDFLVVSFSSDWLYPTTQSRAMVQAMKKSNLDVNFCEIQIDNGHDSFLVQNPRLAQLISSFLDRQHREWRSRT